MSLQARGTHLLDLPLLGLGVALCGSCNKGHVDDLTAHSEEACARECRHVGTEQDLDSWIATDLRLREHLAEDPDRIGIRNRVSEF